MVSGKLEELREKFEERVALITVSFLVVELLMLMIQIIFIYADEYSSRYYFYVFSICALMLGTIYFAWHSQIKENAFELLGFEILSGLLCFHGLYMVFSDSPYVELTIISLVVLVSAQLFYLFSFYFAYHRFGWRYFEELNTTNLQEIHAFKVYETMMSLLKVDYYLYSLNVATYFYYVLNDWDDFIVVGCIIGTLAYLLLMAHSLLGLIAATRELRQQMILYLVGSFIVGLLKFYFVIVVVINPGNKLDLFIMVQAIVISFTDLGVILALVYLGFVRLRTFKIQIHSLIRHHSDDALRSPFK